MGAWPPLVVAALLCCACAVLCAPDWTDECPTACRCKWSSGKKTALCRDAGFTTLPAALNSDMQVLDLTGNAIPYLTEDAFRSVGLINLQRVFIRSARVREVHKDAFRDLIILVEVDLSENLITSLHPETFLGNLRLRVLCLSGNPLRELRAEQFSSLPHLRSIELENCQLTAVNKNAFAHVNGLELLNLKDNKLSELSEAVFAPIPRLKTLVLDGNPWYCDCRLRGFRNWFLASKLRQMAPTCTGPRPLLAGRTWQSVPAERFACAPQVTVTERLVQVEAGGNVSVGCRVRGDPEPEATWLYNGRVIGSANATRPDQVLLIEVEEGLLDKWINISVYNVSELDAGEYSCVARNLQGAVSRNVTLLLPAAGAVVSTLSHGEATWLWVWVVVAASIAGVLLAGVGVCCACGRKRQRSRKRHRRKAKLKGSVSFTDQEKKLLDLSITTTERQSAADSCEMLGGAGDSQPDLEALEAAAAGPMELCEQQPPVHITIESHAQETGIMRPPPPSTSSAAAAAGAYPATLGVYPPPPEFSTSILPVGAFGNILISVSVSQDPSMDIQRYPDLLDIPHRATNKSTSKAVSVAAGPDLPFCLSAESYATLPRRQPLRPAAPCGGGSPYDNMGPRVTAGGSSTLSLPDVDPDLMPEDIPPPPPPPICSPLAGEYVSL